LAEEPVRISLPANGGYLQKRVIAGPVEGATIGNILVQAIALKQINSMKKEEI